MAMPVESDGQSRREGAVPGCVGGVPERAPGRGSPQDGFQAHQILDGGGRYNRFEGNTATVNGTGYGFHFTPANDNVWTCDNKVQNAERGAGNTPCAS